jgi:hypothetical protein
VDFGCPLGNQMGPHSRNISLTFSGVLSEKIRGSLGISQYMKGDSVGSSILYGNDFVSDTINGIIREHQIYSTKDYRFSSFLRNRTVVSISGTYTFEHWIQTEISGDFVHEQEPAKGNYFRAGMYINFNY